MVQIRKCPKNSHTRGFSLCMDRSVLCTRRDQASQSNRKPMGMWYTEVVGSRRRREVKDIVHLLLHYKLQSSKKRTRSEGVGGRGNVENLLNKY